jgi:alpha-tubulin suppressor-like RCC1 family protein
MLPALWLGTGCRENKSSQPPPGQVDETVSARFSIVLDEATSAAFPRRVSAFSISHLDVTRIRVDVKEKDSGIAFYDNFDLTRTDGKWSGTLPFLPKNKPLTFHARAYNGTNVQIFGGSTDQTLTLDNETVNITLIPAGNGQTITLPRITRITIPTEFPADKRGNISFSVSANTGESLTYIITPASGGGSFSPVRGTITLLSAAGTFVSQYTPPRVSERTSYTHEVTVTNEKGHSVTTTFTTVVLPPAHEDVLDPVIKVVFNPVIHTIAARQVVGTTDVIWKATVTDDGPLSELSYLWSLTPNGTFDPTPGFNDATTNPTTMGNYTPSVQGQLTLEVTDSQGGKTLLKYNLTPEQFPDDLYDEGNLGGLNIISAGIHHTCALLDNSRVRCWGYNNHGQLGYGNTTQIGDNEHPYTAGDVDFTGNALQVVTGSHHTCVLLDTGFVRCWGYNGHGELGYGTTENVGDGEPVTSQGYVNLGGRAVKLAAGLYHTCAVLTTGKVRCWGYNGYGQLGYGNTNNVGDDEAVWTKGDVDLGGLAKDITAGGHHTCALLTTGKVRCWGYNGHGELGYANTRHYGDDEHPSIAGDVDVGGLVKQLSAGTFHTCALLETGNVRCWGYGYYGQLGYPSYAGYNYIGDNEKPSAVGDITVGDKVLQIAASIDGSGVDHTCALLSTGTIKCWGYNGYGGLGYGNTSQYNAPGSTTVDLSGASAYYITTGAYHTCALLSTGKARCWGYNSQGQLGYASTRHYGDDEQPSAAGDIQISAPTP